MHEASQWEKNCFITLTYAPEHLPRYGDLNYRHFQLFMYRLRQKYGSGIRFYMCGEYGGQFSRPHYHAILFNHDFEDKKIVGTTKTGHPEYNSEILKELWGLGRTSLGEATEQSAAYCARYITEKISGLTDAINPKTGEPFGHKYRIEADAEDQANGVIYHERQKEFNRMSLKPGIGQDWFDKFYKDIYPSDAVRMRDGRSVRPPRYYDKKYDELHPFEFEDIKQKRYEKALKSAEQTTPERLEARSVIQSSAMTKFNRSIDI
jgi:hypothetical protein